MPLVNISIVKGKPPGYAKAIADGVNSAVIETMGFPRTTAIRSSPNTNRIPSNTRRARLSGS
jgi:hypothetical protein